MKFKNIVKRIKFRTWVALSIIAILLPLVVFRFIYQTLAAPPVANTRWKMDEAQGTTLQDASTNDNDGTTTGAVYADKSRCLDGNCLFFDGADDRVTRADDADMDFSNTDSFTITFWFRHQVESSGTDMIITKFVDDADTEGGYRIQEESDGDLTCGIDDDNNSFPEDSVTSTAANYDDAKWHHAACVKTTTSSLRLYIDGNEVGTADVSISSTGTLANGEAFYMGADNGGTTNEYTGYLDDMRIYRSALTAAEIKTDFNFGAATRFADQPSDFLSEGLAGYWPMDETTDGATATDGSGGAAPLTDVGTVARAGGKFGNGADFENTVTGSDYQQVSSSTAPLDVLGSFTLAGWIKAETICSQCSIFGKGNGSSGGYEIHTSSGATAFTFRYYDVGGGITVDSAASTFVTGTWVHVVGVHNDSTDTDIIYINGVQSGIQTSRTSNPATSAADFETGGINGFHGEYDGILDDIRVYNRALDSSEALALYRWTPGAVGYWKMDDNTGQTVTDSSGNGYNGNLGDDATTETDDATWGLGKFGSSTEYNGGTSDRTVTVADTDLLDISATGSMTISAWVKRDGNASSNNEMMIVDKQDSGSAAGYNFTLESLDCGTSTTDGEKVCFRAWDGTDDYSLLTTSTITSGSGWHHVAAVWDNDNVNNTNIFIDGVVQAVTRTGTFGNVDSISNAVPFCIGVDNANDCSTANEFNGNIDELRVYNYARTSQQIVEDMNGGHPTGGSPIGTATSYYKFDEGYGTTAFDDIDPNSNDLTLSATAWTASGKFDKAWDGNGVKYLSRADDDDFDFAAAEDGTFSMWYKSDSASNPGATEYLLDKSLSGGTQSAGYAIYTKTTGVICFGVDDDTTWTPDDEACSTADFYDATWHHIVAEKTGTSRIDIYIDGNLVGSDTTIAATATLANARIFYIGDRDGTDNGDEFNGNIDEVKIFRSLLTSDQVKLMFNATGAAANFGTGTSEDTQAGINGNAPVAWFAMDENSGTTINDKTGTTNTGTLQNQAKWNTGKIGSSVYFNGDETGNDTSIVLTDNAYNALTTGTVEFWFKPNDTGDDWQNMFSMFGGSDGANQWEVGYERSTDRVHIWSTGCAGTNIRGYIAIPNPQSTWRHFAIVDSSSGNSFYLDGVQQAVTYTSGTNATDCFFDDIVNVTAKFHLGCVSTGGTSACFSSEVYEGDLDDVKIYDYVRSAPQIAYDANRGGPFAWWKLEDCTGTNVNDLSKRADNGSTAMDLTLTVGGSGSNTTAGACSDGNTAHNWHNGTNGKFNSALDFDGTDDYAACTDASCGGVNNLDMSTTPNFSISAWIKFTTSGTQVFLGKKTDTTSGTAGYQMLVSSNNFAVCRLSDGTTQLSPTGTTALNDGNWHNIICIDTSSVMQTWVDGVKENEANISTITGTIDNTSDFRIGSTGGGGTFFDGLVDEVRIFKYTLSTDQMLKLRTNNASGVRFGPSTGLP